MSTPAQIRQVDRDLAVLTERLISEYEDDLPAGSVIRTVARVVARLRDRRVPLTDLPSAVEPLARAELNGRAHRAESAPPVAAWDVAAGP